MEFRKQGLLLLSAAVATVLACGDDSDDGKGSGGRDALGGCEEDRPASCSSDEVEAFANCSTTKCDDEYKECLGDGYKDGNFGGVCGEYQECVTACGCGDTDCVTDCGAPPSDCTSCLIEASECVSDKCELPECFSDFGDDEGDGDSGDGDEGDGDSGDGDSGDGDSGDGDSTGASFTCDDLEACCAGLTGSKQDECEMAHTQASKTGDIACNVAYSIYQMNGTCD